MQIIGRGIVLTTSVLVASCTLNMGKMQATFSEHLNNTVGRSFEELKNSPTQAFIGKRVPQEIKALSNGGELHVYNYWSGTNAVREGACMVYLTFNASKVVTSAKSEGKGCYTAY